MAPKTLPPAAKLASVLKYFHGSAVAHSIKDLEKALPSIASINGMQVKDYLQALSDENMIHVEKIGSGNWYWSFPGEANRTRQDMLNKATDERNKAVAVVQELHMKIAEATSAREDNDHTVTEAGLDRESLSIQHAELTKELGPLNVELASYSDNDPVEIEKKRLEAVKLKQEAENLTEQIQCMEGYIRDTFMGGDRMTMLSAMQQWYGDQFDDDEQGLKEII